MGPAIPASPEAAKPRPPAREVLRVAEHGDGWGVPAEWEQAPGATLVRARLAFALSWTAVVFFLVAFIMVPFGQWTAAGMRALGRPLAGYSLNVAGSLVGILLYTTMTAAWLPPLCWFVPVALCCALLAGARDERQQLLAISVGLLLMLLPDDGPARQDTWSSYQKLTLVGGNHVVVNNAGYQTMDVQRNTAVDRISMPYLLRRPPGDVLVVGAGTGNDVAAALAAGARSVVAVEIDAAILEMGRRAHPQAPYRDPRVQVVIDDARHYLKTSRRRLDLIVFSHLDAHTVLSSFTNVRLDNYIYTVEAFEEARRRLGPQGFLYLSFFAQRPFISERLYRRAWPTGEAFDRRVFWLGAAFMLLEVHNVSRLALVFGTTWKVNAWVIGTVLTVILAANAVCARLQRRERKPGGLTAAALFASLGAAYLVPVGAFAGLGQLAGLAITLVMTLPMFFAGLVFADAFSRSPAPAFALGWNVLGAVAGGMAESVAYIIGIPGLVIVAAGCYALALAPGSLVRNLRAAAR